MDFAEGSEVWMLLLCLKRAIAAEGGDFLQPLRERRIILQRDWSIGLPPDCARPGRVLLRAPGCDFIRSRYPLYMATFRFPAE